MATKGRREKIKLTSTGKTKEGKSTGYFYTTNKNKSANAEKMEMKKFDPRAYNASTGRNGAHVNFREEKIK